MAKKHNRASLAWQTMDIHIHTPASSDYQQPDVTYLDILQRAENRNLDIIAFTDHNTISGYRKMQEDVSQLEMLEKLNRLLPEEKSKLSEYRRLLNKILVLPGFELTATFGFHILAIFPIEKPVREIEHLLLTLNIPPQLLDDGSATVGATTDVLTAYRMINQAGGLVIAAHANSSNGVAMRGFNFGGQTKIAYTQDPNLHALEVTDLELKSGHSTAAFFSGTKPEYPRHMHCIQGSDCHRLSADAARKKNLGIGDRATDVLIPEVSFEALLDLFSSNDFTRTRPHRHKEDPVFDYIQIALDQGANIIQDFHESMTVRSGKLYAVLSDVCAFSNTNGGTLYIGLSSDSHKPPLGVQDIEQNIATLERELSNRISPPLQCSIDIQDFKGKKLIRVLVPRGNDAPYALDDNKIYIRNEAETELAVRDEIVDLVLRGFKQPVKPVLPAVSEPLESQPIETIETAVDEKDTAPRTGVEVLNPEDRDGRRFFSMRDLRNGNVVKNVTKTSARRLWHYALTQYTELPSEVEKAVLQWQGDYGLLKSYKQGRSRVFDFVQRTSTGYRFFYGVTLDGIHGPWKQFLASDEASDKELA